jgi:CPA2 family monovalent cation:H+ antiporter-2
MNHLAPLIQDLSIILITAAVTSLVFKKLRQPVILGYMMAGVLISPHLRIFPNVTDVSSIQVWAEMGVIFMLFSLGIEFSFRKLAQVGSTVIIAGLFELTAMCCMGFMVGKFLLDWTTLQSLFLGSMLCISSTSIIFKAYEEFGLKTKRFAQLVFGILIVEDLMAVLLTVLLTTLGLTQQFEGTELLWIGGKLLFYLVWWFVIGLFLVPWSLRVIRPLLSDETTLIVSLALCLMMVVTASQAGFSAALGAFIMGSILGETEEKEKIEKILQPVKNLFSAVFFVSVGMLIDPQAIIDHPGLILLFASILIVGKIYYATAGALIAGQPVQIAIPAAISLAQIGEFSFIIASLGMTMKVLDQSIYSTIIAVSALTTFTTPYLIRSRVGLSEKIEKVIPPAIQKFLFEYLQFSNLVKASPEWRALLRSYLMKIFINVIIVIACFLSTSRFLYPIVEMKSEAMHWAQIITLTITLLIASPFLWAIVYAHPRSPDLLEIVEEHVSPSAQRALVLFRVGIALILLASLLTQYVSLALVGIAAVIIFAALAFSLFRFMGSIYMWLENRFLKQIDQHKTTHVTPVPVLAPWDAHLSEYDIHPESDCVGKTLAQLHLRENFGIIIAMIQRGQRHIPAPSRDEMLMPHDRVSVIGTDEQLAEFENYLSTYYVPVGGEKPGTSTFILDQYLVTDRSPFIHRPIRECGIREKTSGLVVGIERAGRRILNPDSSLTIQNGDLLWIVGNSHKLRELK